MERPGVVIVGAGPVGLTAAALLADRGVDSLVVERYAEPYPLPRAVHLDDEAVRILQDIGVADGFAGISRPALGLRLLGADHRVLAEFRRDRLVGEHGHPQANLFDQPDLERLLRAAVAARPRIEVRYGTELTGRTPAGVALRDVATGAVRQVAAAAVLGCDGAGSRTRDLIGAHLLDLGFSERWLVVDVRSDRPIDAWNGVDQVCDPRRAATFMRIGAERYRWEFRLRSGETAADLLRPDRFAALLAPWADAAGLPVLRAAEYVFTARIADRWRRGPVFLLGDAAHLTPPFIGQGLGSGLRDAHNLAWKLALVLAGRADGRLLDTYQAERAPHARSMIRLAVTAGWAMTGGQDRAAAVRRVALAGLWRIPGATALVLRGTSPPLRGGPLVRRTRMGPGALAGTRCPQPRVAGRPLDEVLGSGFALLTDGPPDPATRALAERLSARVLDLRTGTVTVPPPPDAVADAAAAPGAAADPADAGLAALRDWLGGARAGAVLLRPDRVVLAAARAGHPFGPVPALSWFHPAARDPALF